MILQNFFELFSPLNWIRLFWGWVKWKCLLRLILIYAFQNRPNSKGWRTANSKPWNSIRNSQECLKDKIVKKNVLYVLWLFFLVFMFFSLNYPVTENPLPKIKYPAIFFVIVSYWKEKRSGCLFSFKITTSLNKSWLTFGVQ